MLVIKDVQMVVLAKRQVCNLSAHLHTCTMALVDLLKPDTTHHTWNTAGARCGLAIGLAGRR